LKRSERSSSGRATAPQRCVLVVDDEVDILELIELTLLRMGLDVERAMNVREAIGKLSQHHFDLCLTDMRLPDGTGIEIVDHAREIRAFPAQGKRSEGGGASLWRKRVARGVGCDSASARFDRKAGSQ
jgi:response regulator receiver domain-containing protein